MPRPTVLITGASGHLGRRVAELVLAAHSAHVVLATRTPAKLADFAAQGAEVRTADFDDPASLASAFAGVDRLLLVSTDALAVPGQRLAQHRAAITAAVAAGVRHIVYTSLAQVSANSVSSAAPDHLGTEAALAHSGLSYTILRNNLYADGLLPPLAHAVATGVLASASGNGRIAYVTREDCARAAAAALLADDYSRRTLEISGPAALTVADLAALATRLTGRAVRHLPLSADELRSAMTASGLPPFVVELLVTFDLAAAHGELGLVTSDVADLTQQAPAAVADFLSAHRAALTTATI